MWNITLHTLDENNLVKPKNNPLKSGKYLCTCVNFWNGEEVARYLQVMYYDASKKYWHDSENARSISHNILAWTDKIEPCAFTDFNYLIGGHFVKKHIEEDI